MSAQPDDDGTCCPVSTTAVLPNTRGRVTWWCTLPDGHGGDHFAGGSAPRGQEYTWPNPGTAVAYLVAERRDGRWLIGDEWSTEYATLDDARAHLRRFGTRGYDMGILAVTLVEVTP